MAHDPVVIIPYQDGPYLVRGPVVLRDQEGRSITVSRRTVALCRCGKSRTRPFCDGTHQVIRFRAGSGAEGAAPSGSDREPSSGEDETPSGGDAP